MLMNILLFQKKPERNLGFYVKSLNFLNTTDQPKGTGGHLLPVNLKFGVTAVAFLQSSALERGNMETLSSRHNLLILTARI